MIPHLRAVAIACALTGCPDAVAQIAGNGLGTAVSQSGAAWTISAGTQLGGNLFHSFSTFGIPTGQSATFSGPGSVQNVIARVTGPSPSTIDGVLRSTISGAQLWLINPKGVTFGPNASLDVPGSVHVSTADYLKLGSSGQFNATNPGASTLASAPPSAFGFLGPPAPINVGAADLAARGISLVGGDITLSNALLTARGGALNLAALRSAGEIAVGDLVAAGVGAYGDLSFTGANLRTTSLSSTRPGGIRIVGGNLVANDSPVEARTSRDSPGGNVQVTLSGALTLGEHSWIAAETYAAGAAGTTDVTAQSIAIAGGHQTYSGIYGDSVGSGNAGLVTVTADTLTLRGNALISSDAFDAGPGGTVRLTAGDVMLRDGAQISAQTFGAGSGGTVSVSAGHLSIRGVRGATSGIFGTGDEHSTADAGRVLVTAGTIEVGNHGSISSDAYGSGNGGDVSVTAQTLNTSGTGSISSSLYGGGGRGGNVDVTVAGRLTLKGAATGNITGGIFTDADTGTHGAAGNATVRAGEIFVVRDGQITSSAWGAGNGGAVSVSAAGRIVVRDAGIFAVSNPGATGDAGNVSVAGASIVLKDAGGITSSTWGDGDAGTVSVTATGRLHITGGDGHGGNSGIYSSTYEGAGNAGRLVLSAGSIILDDGARVASGTFSAGRGGSISVTTPGRLLISGVDPGGTSTGIFANSQHGTGDAGAIAVRAGSVALKAGGAIVSSTFTSGRGGSIGLVVDGSLLIDGEGPGGVNSGILSNASRRTGNAGAIDVTAASVTVGGGGVISSSTFAAGNGGTVTVSTPGALQISGRGTSGDASGIFAATSGRGAGGSVQIRAGDVILRGAAEIGSDANGNGAAGSTTIEAQRPGEGALQLTEDSAITGTTLLAGRGGNIVVSGFDAVRFSGFASMSTIAFGAGQAGSIAVQANKVLLDGVNYISSAGGGRGDGGSVRIEARDLVRVVQYSSLDASGSSFSTGRGGSVKVGAGEVVLDGGAISAVTEARGAGGNIEIEAGTLRLLNGGSITAETRKAPAGNIVIRARDLVYLRDSSITTSAAAGEGDGGNITIDPQFVVLDNSQIIANAFRGRGGNITIVADNFLSQGSIVQAASELGVSGNVVIASPRVDVSGALRALSSDYLDASRLIRASCASRAGQASSTFIGGLRGGLAERPDSGKELAERRAVALGCAPFQGMAPVLDAPAAGNHHVAN